jgi:hypothetical protein
MFDVERGQRLVQPNGSVRNQRVKQTEIVAQVVSSEIAVRTLAICQRGGWPRKKSIITSVSSSICCPLAIFGLVAQLPSEGATVRDIRSVRPDADQIGTGEVGAKLDWPLCRRFIFAVLQCLHERPNFGPALNWDFVQLVQNRLFIDLIRGHVLILLFWRHSIRLSARPRQRIGTSPIPPGGAACGSLQPRILLRPARYSAMTSE